jgi:hypothetical protein
MIHRTILILMVVIFIVWLAGCAPATPPVPVTALAAPEPRLLAQIKDLPPVHAGDDLVQSTAVCRAEYGRTASIARGLQGWVNVVRKQ